MDYKPKYFRDEEFWHCCPTCSLDDMQEELLIKLDKAREILSEPIQLTSAYRAQSYEKSKGRSGNSTHCFGAAVDIWCPTSSYRFRLIPALYKAGFTRIGIGSNFVHVDVAHLEDCLLHVMWTY